MERAVKKEDKVINTNVNVRKKAVADIINLGQSRDKYCSRATHYSLFQTDKLTLIIDISAK